MDADEFPDLIVRFPAFRLCHHKDTQTPVREFLDSCLMAVGGDDNTDQHDISILFFATVGWYDAAMRRIIGTPLISILLFGAFMPLICVKAQESAQQSVVLARVIDVRSEEVRTVPGTDTTTVFQELTAEILEGPDTGKVVDVANDFLQLKEGGRFYALKTTEPLTGEVYYTVNEAYRLPALSMLLALFVATVFLLGGKQGVRGLLSLIGSLLLIFFVLIPLIIGGYHPLLVAVGVSSLIVVAGSYLTHGVSRMTSAAVLGMVATLVLTGLLGTAFVEWVKLTGTSEESALYLHFSLHGAIDLGAVLLAGIMIGLLGVLYDAAIGQAVAVDELYRANPAAQPAHVYRRARRMGREHIGALVNTLAIAYVGAALPLLLLLATVGSEYFVLNLNREFIATEIVRTLVGSIGIMLAVPITTHIAVAILRPKNRPLGSDS